MPLRRVVPEAVAFVRDFALITSRRPGGLPAFARALVAALQKGR